MRRLHNGTPVSALSILHYDGLGSVRAVTNAAGLKSGTASYRPYGEQSEGVWTALLNETKGYIGTRYDADAGLQYLNARYYDPRLGMFVQPDWWEVMIPGVGTNRYSYAFGDPVNGKDPTGHKIDPTADYEEHKKKQGEDKKNNTEDLRLAQNTPQSSGRRGTTPENIPQALLNEIERNLIARIDAVRAQMGLNPVPRIGPREPAATPESIASLRADLVRHQLAQNNLQGTQFEKFLDKLLGPSVIGRQITIETSTGARTRIDHLTSGQVVIEGKSGASTRLSPGQAQLMDDIVNGRQVTPTGQNAATAGLQPGRPVTFGGYAMSHPSLFRDIGSSCAPLDPLWQ